VALAFNSQPGFDSDVDREKNTDYTSKMFATTSSSSAMAKAGGEPTVAAPKWFTEIAVNKVPKSSALSLPTETTGVSRTIDNEHVRRVDHVAVENVNSLQLSHVFGYRGYDCGHNVYYVDDGAAIVYHTAGVGVVQNVKTGWRNLYFSLDTFRRTTLLHRSHGRHPVFVRERQTADHCGHWTDCVAHTHRARLGCEDHADEEYSHRKT